MQKIIDLYLDYVNNFISVSGFAAHYNLTEQDAVTIIDMGKKYHYLSNL